MDLGKILEFTTNMLVWLDNISSLLMVLLTFFYVIYTQRILKANKTLVEQQEHARKEENMPNVIAYFDCPKVNVVNFVVKNIGKNSAIDTYITFEEIIGINEGDYLRASNIINNNISTIAPNQTITNFVNMMFDLKNSDGNFPKIKVNIKFHDLKGEKYENTFILDLNVYKKRVTIGSKDLGDLIKEVEKIRKTLEQRN